MKINVRKDNLGEHYARAFEHKIGSISKILYQSNKNIILKLDDDFNYLSHKIIEEKPEPVKPYTPKIIRSGRHSRIKSFTKKQLDEKEHVQEILRLVKEGNCKRYQIQVKVGVTYAFLKKVFQVYDIICEPHQKPKFRK
jgi:hypothetical protein